MKITRIYDKSFKEIDYFGNTLKEDEDKKK